MNTTSSVPASPALTSLAPVLPGSALAPYLARGPEARSIRAFGSEIKVLLSGRETGGAYTAFLDLTPPGGGPPPHRHANEDEWFYVLDGVVSFLIDGRWHDAQPGDLVFAPRSSVHTFKNNSAQTTRMLLHTAPAGFEDFYAEAEQEFNRPGGPDMGRAVAIAAKHGIEIMG